MSTTLKLAVCLFPDVCSLDYQGPVELFGFLTPRFLDMAGITSPVLIKILYLGVTMDPVTPGAGPSLVPTGTYEGAKEQYDILLVPGGLGTHPDVEPKALSDFIKRQAPGAKYILSVCTGTEVLARAGVLTGKRATTNKSTFKRIVSETTSYNVTWVPKARWVVDGNVWTSSGVTAGADMGYSFLEHLVGHDIANTVRGIVELNIHKQDDDEFAEFYGLA